MHIFIPLFIILIFFNHKQLKIDHYYRAFAFSIVGIYYFCAVQYCFYWIKVFPEDHLYAITLLFIFTAATVGIGLSKWGKRTSPYKTGLAAATFLGCLIMNFTFDIKIKNWLAEKGGYFTSENIAKPKPQNLQGVNIIDLGLLLYIDDDWQRHTLDTGHIFFSLIENGSTVAELRPNCTEGFNVDIPTYVQNTLALFEAPDQAATVQCGIDGREKHCLIKVKYVESRREKEKWRFLKIDNLTEQGIELDLVVFTNPEDHAQEFNDVVARTKLVKKTAQSSCTTPAAWL